MSVVYEDIRLFKRGNIQIAGTPARRARDYDRISVLFEFVGKLPCLTFQTFGELQGNRLRIGRGKSFQNRIEFSIVY